MHGKGDHRAEDQNEHERTFKLPEQQAKSVGAPVLLDGILAIALEPARGLGLGQAGRLRAERSQQLGGIDGPVRPIRPCIRNDLLHCLQHGGIS